MTKLFHLNYTNIPGEFYAITASGFLTLALLMFVKTFSRILLKMPCGQGPSQMHQMLSLIISLKEIIHILNS